MRAFQDWCEAWAREVYRVMKPGAHLVAFGGTRTYHRLACAIEDAGFEVRDQLAWVYGTGFPKSLDVGKAIDRAAGAEREVVGVSARCVGPSQKAGYRGTATFREAEDNPGNLLTAPATDAAKQWQGWGTALKPAWEPIVLARKPLACPTVAAQVLATGTGALNVDGCRVATEESLNGGAYAADKHKAGGIYGKLDYECGEYQHPAGRWPANLCHDGSPEVLEAFGRFGEKPTRLGKVTTRTRTGAFGSGAPGSGGDVAYRDDTGTAARFFPALGFGEDELRFMYSAKASRADRCGSRHPTVKPLALMRWLCRLVTPPGGTVLDCFAGTGVTGEACLREGFAAVLIEREAEYLADIHARLARHRAEAPLLAEVAA